MKFEKKFIGKDNEGYLYQVIDKSNYVKNEQEIRVVIQKLNSNGELVKSSNLIFSAINERIYIEEFLFIKGKLYCIYLILKGKNSTNPVKVVEIDINTFTTVGESKKVAEFYSGYMYSLMSKKTFLLKSSQDSSKFVIFTNLFHDSNKKENPHPEFYFSVFDSEFNVLHEKDNSIMSISCVKQFNEGAYSNVTCGRQINLTNSGTLYVSSVELNILKKSIEYDKIAILKFDKDEKYKVIEYDLKDGNRIESQKCYFDEDLNQLVLIGFYYSSITKNYIATDVKGATGIFLMAFDGNTNKVISEMTYPFDDKMRTAFLSENKINNMEKGIPFLKIRNIFKKKNGEILMLFEQNELGNVITNNGLNTWSESKNIVIMKFDSDFKLSKWNIFLRNKIDNNPKLFVEFTKTTFFATYDKVNDKLNLIYYNDEIKTMGFTKIEHRSIDEDLNFSEPKFLTDPKDYNPYLYPLKSIDLGNNTLIVRLDKNIMMKSDPNIFLGILKY